MGSRQLDFSHNSSFSMESQLDRLALESTVLNSVLNTFSNIIPSLTEKLSAVYASLVPESDLSKEFKQTKQSLSELKVKLPHAKYVDYDKTLVSVPEGFKGDLLEYIAVLSNIAPRVFQGANETLSEYNFVLSSFITNKDAKTALKDHTALYKKIKHQREEMTEQLNKFFPLKGNLAKAYLGETITRFADVDMIVTQAEKLKQAQKSQNLKEISDSVKKSVDLLTIIVDDTRNNGIAQVSGNAALNVSQGAYELGKYIEFVALYRYRVEQAVASACKLTDDLNRIL